MTLLTLCNEISFSVIVPVYNAEHTVAATVERIRAQTIDDIEIILVDDGSTDASLHVLLRQAEADQRIRLVSQSNGGVSEARNTGLALAKGRYIAFCDADDLWEHDKLACHLAFHRANPALAASYAQIAFLPAAAADCTCAQTFSTVPEGPLTVEQILSENPVCTTSNLVVTRSAMDRIGGFSETMNYAEDQEWLARAVSQGEQIVGIPTMLVGYRLSLGGLSVDLEKMYDGWVRLATLYGDGQLTSSAEAVFCRYLARRALRSGNQPSHARHYAFRGLRLDARAFLRDTKRGVSTLIAAVFAQFMPSRLRIHLFA